MGKSPRSGHHPATQQPPKIRLELDVPQLEDLVARDRMARVQEVLAGDGDWQPVDDRKSGLGRDGCDLVNGWDRPGLPTDCAAAVAENEPAWRPGAAADGQIREDPLHCPEVPVKHRRGLAPTETSIRVSAHRSREVREEADSGRWQLHAFGEFALKVG